MGLQCLWPNSCWWVWIWFWQCCKDNFFYGASPLTTVGADISYNILPELSISGGYYYQYSEKETDKYESYPDGSGFKARLAYDLSDQLQAGVVYTYDENFESRVSAEIKVRFGSGAKPQSERSSIVFNALTATPSHRNVRSANSKRDEDERFYVCRHGSQARDTRFCRRPRVCRRGSQARDTRFCRRLRDREIRERMDWGLEREDRERGLCFDEMRIRKKCGTSD